VCVCVCVYVCVCVRLCVCQYTCFNFLGPIGSEGRRRSREEEEEEALKRKQLHEEHLSKVSEITLSYILI